MLIGTKVDLLPAGSNPAEIAEWLRAFAAFKRISAVSVHLVSCSFYLFSPFLVFILWQELRLLECLDARQHQIGAPGEVLESLCVRDFV